MHTGASRRHESSPAAACPGQPCRPSTPVLCPRPRPPLGRCKWPSSWRLAPDATARDRDGGTQESGGARRRWRLPRRAPLDCASCRRPPPNRRGCLLGLGRGEPETEASRPICQGSGGEEPFGPQSGPRMMGRSFGTIFGPIWLKPRSNWVSSRSNTA